jgi:hypothetical protein
VRPLAGPSRSLCAASSSAGDRCGLLASGRQASAGPVGRSLPHCDRRATVRTNPTLAIGKDDLQEHRAAFVALSLRQDQAAMPGCLRGACWPLGSGDRQQAPLALAFARSEARHLASAHDRIDRSAGARADESSWRRLDRAPRSRRTTGSPRIGASARAGPNDPFRVDASARSRPCTIALASALSPTQPRRAGFCFGSVGTRRGSREASRSGRRRDR